MDRLETIAVADDHGVIHVAVGAPHASVRIVIEPAPPESPATARARACRAEAQRLAAKGVWVDHEELVGLRHLDHGA